MCACVCVCHFIHSPESRRLTRSVEGGGGRVSRGSSLIDVFWGWRKVGGLVLRMMRGWELDGTPQQEGGRALKWGRRGW